VHLQPRMCCGKLLRLLPGSPGNALPHGLAAPGRLPCLLTREDSGTELAAGQVHALKAGPPHLTRAPALTQRPSNGLAQSGQLAAARGCGSAATPPGDGLSPWDAGGSSEPVRDSAAAATSACASARPAPDAAARAAGSVRCWRRTARRRSAPPWRRSAPRTCRRCAPPTLPRRAPHP